MTREEAFDLFDQVYGMRTVRDTIYESLSMHHRGEIVISQKGIETFAAEAAKYNEESNSLCMRLADDGYFVSRDESNNYIPTLRHGGKAVATWWGFGCVLPA